MVMEYLEGRDLSAWLKERGALPVEQAVEFVLQACEAIAEAHAIGIVHRDLKPANLFCVVRSDGLHAVKVLDFGISKLTGLSASGSDMAMTRTQALMGSPFYMSPEQMQSTRTSTHARTSGRSASFSTSSSRGACRSRARCSRSSSSTSWTLRCRRSGRSGPMRRPCSTRSSADASRRTGSIATPTWRSSRRRWRRSRRGGPRRPSTASRA